MGDAQRRKLAGDTEPKGMQKSRKMTRKDQLELTLDLTSYYGMYGRGMGAMYALQLLAAAQSIDKEKPRI